MKWLLLLLAALFAAASIATLAARDPGHVILLWGGWSAETSAVFFVIALGLSALLLHFLARALRGLFRLPELMRRWRGDRRSLQAEELLALGVQASLTAQWPRAERYWKRWAARGSNPMLGYLHAARAAEAQGAERRRDHYLRLAADASRSELDLATVRAALFPALAGARADLERLAEQDGQLAASPLVQRVRLQSGLERKAWGDARRALAALARSGGMDMDEAERTERLLVEAALENAATEGALATAWSAVPQKLRREAGVVERYARACLRTGAARDAETIVSEALSRQWSPALARLYGELETDNPGRQLRIAEGWLKRHGTDPDLLLTLGRLALRAGDGERGRAWLEESVRTRPTAAACHELGRWLERLGDTAAALDCYRRGLSAAP